MLILSAALIAIPSIPSSHATSPVPSASAIAHAVSAGDPNGTLTAFNYTYSQANLYTNSSKPSPVRVPSTPVTGTSFSWLNTVTQTRTNATIPTSGFRFNVTRPGPSTPGKQVVNWTLTVPQFNCRLCTGVSVDFNFFGNITKGTNATYVLTLAPPNSTKIIASPTPFTTAGPFVVNTGNCPEDVCQDVSKYVGYNVTLSFIYGWNGNSSNPGMFADVGEIVVASTGGFIQSSSNFMQQDSTNSSQIIHTTNLSFINYNNTLKTPLHPGSANITKTWWNIEVISIYYPSGYSVKQVSLNSTQIFPKFTPNPNEVPFETDHCVPGTNCSQALLALNMTDFAPVVPHNSTITITSTTPNSISPLTTLLAGAPSPLFAPQDTLALKVINKPAVTNASTAEKTGNLNLVFTDHTGTTHSFQTQQGQSFPLSTAFGGVYNITLPSDCSSNACGTWSIFANFTSGFDLGIMSASFRVDQMQVSSFSVSGSNTGLLVQGTLAYASGSPATTASGILFAVDSETPTNIPVTSPAGSSTGGLYISNITLINGIFTQGQPLIIDFTIVNPSTTAYNASVTLAHEWPGSVLHGVNVNFTLGAANDTLGDLPFINGPQSYQASLTLTASGIQMSLISLNNRSAPKTVNMSLGTSPVVPSEQHAGLFKITVVTKLHGSNVATNSLESPPYAYLPNPNVFGFPIVPSRYLAYSSTFTSGNISLTMKSDAILGAQKLVVFALARDSSGIILVNNNLSPGFSDSTTLQTSMSTTSPVAAGQSVTAKLVLTSNSTKISETIDVYLNLADSSGSRVVASTMGITIAPGKSQTVSLSFNAPSTTGQYTLTFSSPQYDGSVALASQTLQVTLLQSNLQILIPAAIGVVAAIIILGIFLVKRQPETMEVEEKTKPAGSKPKTPGSGNPPSKSLT
jgi:hypothetical protein